MQNYLPCPPPLEAEPCPADEEAAAEEAVEAELIDGEEPIEEAEDTVLDAPVEVPPMLE